MNLPSAPVDYNLKDQSQLRREIDAADKLNRKKQQDVEVARGERLIMTDEVTGFRYVVSIQSGSLTLTAL